MLDRRKLPLDYQNWLQIEPDGVSLRLAELIAVAKRSTMAEPSHAIARVGLDWPTLLLAAGIYAAFAAITWFYHDLPWWLVLPLGAAIVCLQGSLQHETIHGYPTRWGWLNYLIALPPLSLLQPYGIQRADHLTHHIDQNLTDPRLDPESNYVTPDDWFTMSDVHRAWRKAMASLLGRLVIGPFYVAARSVWRLIQAVKHRDGAVLIHWALHIVMLAALLGWIVVVCDIPLLGYVVLFAWPGTALTLMRSYAEHRAAADVPARTATVEAGPLMSFLFLYNNLHALHHAEPALAWYRRPGRYRATRNDVLGRSRYHLIDSYGVLARDYLFAPKEPLFHPAMVRAAGAPHRSARR